MSTTQTQLEWYGNTYTWSDLEKALAVLVAPSFKPSDLTGRAYTSVYKPAAWEGLGNDCVALLRAMAGAHSHIQVWSPIILCPRCLACPLLDTTIA